MDKLILDIETIPAQRQDIVNYITAKQEKELLDELTAVKAPSNYKDEFKIAAYIDETRAKLESEAHAKTTEKIAATGLEGAFGEIFCIGWAVNDGPTHVAVRADLTPGSEAMILRDFFQYLPTGFQKVCVVGHNVSAFDLRFIKQRAMVHGIKPPLSLPLDAKPWDETIYDTMLQWAGVGKTISLDKLALAFGLPGKGEITGKDVWPMVQAGKYQEVATYCKDDVELTRNIFKRMVYL